MAVFLNDTFTDTDGVELPNHTPDTGGTWIRQSGSGQATIQANRCRGSSFQRRYSNNAPPGAAEYDWQANIYGAGGATYLLARFQDMNNHYLARWGGTNYEIWKRVAGVWTQLTTDAGPAPTDGDLHLFEVRNATKKLYIAGVERTSTTDDELTPAGNVGISITGTPLGEFDNAKADDAGAVPPGENAKMQPMNTWWQK